MGKLEEPNNKVEIQLDQLNKVVRIFGYEPYGEKPELDFLIGIMVIQHHDHFETEEDNLWRILTNLVVSETPYVITVGNNAAKELKGVE